MENSQYTSRIYRTIAAAGLMTALTFGSMGCRFQGFSFGFFSYKRKQPVKREIPRSLYRKPYIMNDYTCNSKDSDKISMHLRLEKELANRFEKEKLSKPAESIPFVSQEGHMEKFQEEYGYLEDCLNSEKGPIEGIIQYMQGNKNGTNLTFSFNF